MGVCTSKVQLGPQQDVCFGGEISEDLEDMPTSSSASETRADPAGRRQGPRITISDASPSIVADGNEILAKIDYERERQEELPPSPTFGSVCDPAHFPIWSPAP